MRTKNLSQLIESVIITTLNESYNFIYTEDDYARYLEMENEIVEKLNEILPNDNYFKSIWYRSGHKNDYDLIFDHMNFPIKSDFYKKVNPYTTGEKELVTDAIYKIMEKYSIKSVKISFDSKNRGIRLTKFKDSKIKKRKKGRQNFEYPINGKTIKFIIADRDIVPFVGLRSLNNIFNKYKTFKIDGAYKVVSYQGTYLNRFIKIDEDIFLLNDVEKAYVDFFQDTMDSEAQDNLGTGELMFKKYLLNKLETFNHRKDISDLFDMLETIDFDFVFYDSLDKYTAQHFVRKIED